MAVRVGPDAQRHPFGRAVQGALQDDAPAIEVRREGELRQIRLTHGFQPHRLPDARGAGIDAALALAVALFAGRLQGGTKLVNRVDHQFVVAVARGVGDFKDKGGVAAAMLAEELAIQPDAGGVIHRTEVQQEPLAAQCRRNLEMPPIPNMRQVVRRQAKARELALRAEGHNDSLREVTAGSPAALLALSLGINLELPLAIQIQPRLALEIRARMFGSGNVGVARQTE